MSDADYPRGRARRAACAIIDELLGRSGVGDELGQVDDDIMVEIQDAIQGITSRSSGSARGRHAEHVRHPDGAALQRIPIPVAA